MRTLPIPRTPAEPDDLQAVFVYGTLRPRGTRPGWAEAAEVAPATPGWVPGRLYVGPGFPYATYDPGSPALVRGDVLLCDTRHPMFWHMHNVELRAGYDYALVPVELDSGGTTGALMYVPNDSSTRMFVRSHRRVGSGDWHDDNGVAEVEEAIYDRSGGHA